MSEEDETSDSGIESIYEAKSTVDSRQTGLEKLLQKLESLKEKDHTGIWIDNRDDDNVITVKVTSESADPEFKFLCDISKDLTTYSGDRTLRYDPHSEKYKIIIDFIVHE